MAITGTTTDYTGRTKDIYISQGIDPLYTAGPQKVTYGFGSVSQCIAGVEKLVQRYLILLFNNGLLSKLQSARASNIQQAVHLFNFTNWDTIKTIKAYQETEEGALLPLDEQLLSAQMDNIAIVGDNLSLRIKLVTKAGENIVFVLPVKL